MHTRILLLLLLSTIAFSLSAQQVKDSVGLKTPTKKEQKVAKQDTVVKDSARLALERLPRRAARASAIFPGLGQIQNKRWWKLPLIYGGLAAFVVSYQDNNRQYHVFLKEVQYRLANNYAPQNPDYAAYSFEGIVRIKDNFRRNKELSIFGGLAMYAVNIIDAYVDAKFFRFDISENLSMQVRPGLQTQPFLHAYQPAPALTIKLSL
ncbi:MAG: DUF5683 domain-containing protein [Sphingobacteriaceae bacterium]